LSYSYPKFAIRMGRDSEVIGQIQGLGPPDGSQIVRRISDWEIGDVMKESALETLSAMSAAKMNRPLITILSDFKAIFETVCPDDVGVMPERYRIRLVTVVNEQETVFPPPSKSQKEEGSTDCCIIL